MAVLCSSRRNICSLGYTPTAAEPGQWTYHQGKYLVIDKMIDLMFFLDPWARAARAARAAATAAATAAAAAAAAAAAPDPALVVH